MLNKQEETLLKELLNKYKQGYISGLIPGSNITFSPSGCRNKIVSSTGSGGGGGQIAFTKTKAEIDTLIAGNDLVAGALYEITGVHPTLYDDGTTSGTTVYLRAISGSELEVQGMGKFYNPKYNQSVDGFGIWDNKMYGTFSNVVGVLKYQNKEAVTANNAATGILLADGMIQYVSGDWSTATSITGAVSGATANIAGFVSPSYGVGDKVIWGGYSWTNVNGNIGASVDVLNLDAEWTKNVYDTTNYNIAYDLIEYDYANDMIIRRFEKESNVDVKCSKAQYDFFVVYGFSYHSISVQQFGNALNISSFKGQLNIDVDNGYNESINFSGRYQVYLTFGSGAQQSNLTFGTNAGQGGLTFGSSAYQSNLTFGSNASQQNLAFGSSAYQNNLTFGSGASQYSLTFESDAYQNNLTFGSGASQYSLTFGSNAYQQNLTFGSRAYQRNLTFGSDAFQKYLTFGSNAFQKYLTFGSNAYQQNLTFGSGAYQQDLTFESNAFQQNLTFGSNAYQKNLTFGNYARQVNLTFESDAYQQSLTFGSNAYQVNLTFGSGAIQNNLTFGSSAYQQSLTFGSNAYQNNLTFGSGVFHQNLNFGSNAYQNNLTFESDAGQEYLTFGSNAYQSSLTFGSSAYQNNLTFGSGAYQQNLNFAEKTRLNFYNQTINSNMEYVSFRTKAVVVPNLSAATYIYDGNIKEVYQRPDGALKIKYYDNSDVLQIVDIDD